MAAARIPHGTTTPVVSDADSTGGFYRPYLLSYLIMTWVIAGIAIALPVTFIVAEGYISGGVHARGSMSAYYHTPMQEIFISCLAFMGILLITYRAGAPRSPVFWVSLVSGVTLLGVVFFPTNFSPADARTCYLTAHRPGCGISLSEDAAHGVLRSAGWAGAQVTATLHGWFATIFIASLCVISVLFARGQGITGPRVFKTVHLVCAGIIVLAGLEAILGRGVGDLSRLYIGETASVWAFGTSWLVSGIELRRAMSVARAAPGPAPGQAVVQVPAPVR